MNSSARTLGAPNPSGNCHCWSRTSSTTTAPLFPQRLLAKGRSLQVSRTCVEYEAEETCSVGAQYNGHFGAEGKFIILQVVYSHGLLNL